MSAPSMYGDPPASLSQDLVERCQALDQGIVVQAKGGAILAANPRACEILAMSWEQMSGVTSLDPRWKAIDRAGNPLPGEKHPVMISLTEQRDVLGFLMGVDAGDGALRWLRVDSNYRGDEGEPYAIAVFVDVTETDLGRAAEGSLKDAFRLVIERSFDVISRHSPTGEYLYVTPSSERLLGYRPEELLGHGSYEFVHPDDVEMITKTHTAQAHREPLAIQFRMRHKDGHYVLVETITVPIFDAHGDLLEIQSATRDISESAGLRRQIQDLEDLRAEIAQREQRLRTVLELLPEALLVVDRDGVVAEANYGADELLGQQSEGLPVADLLPEPLGDVTTRMRLGNRWIDARPARVSDGDETIIMLVDVTEPVERAQEMELLARRDGLTGLLTRTALLNELDRLVAEGHPLGVLFVDLDGFKEINDTDGHELGDRVLTEVAGRLRRSVRESDIVGRWGGDEFVVIAPGARAVSLPRIADDILDAVSVPMPAEVVGQERLTVSASVGISNASPGLSAEDLIATADEAMYQAKREGKGRYVIA